MKEEREGARQGRYVVVSREYITNVTEEKCMRSL